MGEYSIHQFFDELGIKHDDCYSASKEAVISRLLYFFVTCKNKGKGMSLRLTGSKIKQKVLR